VPSSLIIVALVVAWLLVLVPIVARRRQEVARTADSTLAARVVRSGGVRASVEEESMSETSDPDTARDLDDLEYDELDEFDEELDGPGDADEEADIAESGQDAEADYDDEYVDEYDDEDLDDEAGYEDYAEYDDYEEDDGVARPYRPGRGGFDPEAAALTARAKYALRQRIVVLLLVLAVVSAVAGGFLMPLIWWAHVAVDLFLVGYLTYLRRQVRIEQEIRDRRTARLGSTRRVHVQPAARRPERPEEPAPTAYDRPLPSHRAHPGTVVVEADDEDPMFDELDEPGVLPYRRAVGE